MNENNIEIVEEKEIELVENEEKTTLKEEKKVSIFHFFKEYQIKDIVFLSIISAIALLSSAVMPLVIPLLHEVFGIAQIVTGFQLSLFFTIGLYKTRKPLSLFYMALFSGIIQAFMSPIVFAGNLLSAFTIELLMFLIFRGKSFDKDYKILIGCALYLPATLPYNFLINYLMNQSSYLMEAQFNNPWIVVGLSIAVLAICILGTCVGYLISRKLKKTGVIKK